MRSISFITIVVATAALTLPAAAQAGSATVLQVHRLSHRAAADTEVFNSVGPVRAKRRSRPVVLAATVRSVSRRVLTVTLADGASLAIPASSLGRGRHGLRQLATLQPGDRLLAVVRFRRDGSMRVRLVSLPAPGEQDLAYEPGEYEGGEYEGGDYEGGDYEGGDYDPGADDSEDHGNDRRPRD